MKLIFAIPLCEAYLSNKKNSQQFLGRLKKHEVQEFFSVTSHTYPHQPASSFKILIKEVVLSLDHHSDQE